MADPFYFTASKTISRFYFNSYDANFKANPFYLTASKTIS